MSGKKVDIYKDTPVRLLGYANEVGEAFRSFIGQKWVLVSYAIATAYVVADTVDKTVKTHQAERNIKKTLFVTTDTLTWQMLASVFIPGYTINRVCAISNYVLKKNSKLPVNNRTILVTGIGLAAIPFIIKPIDRFVDLLLDKSLRKFEP